MSDRQAVLHYTTGRLDILVHFPEREICCWYCPMLVKHTDECRVTGETVYQPKRLIGQRCPIKFEADENGEVI